MLRGRDVLLWMWHRMFSSPHLTFALSEPDKQMMHDWIFNFIYLLILSVFHSAISYNITSVGIQSSKLSKTWQVVKTALKGWNDKHIDWMSAVWKTVLHSAEMVQLLIVFPFSTHTNTHTNKNTHASTKGKCYCSEFSVMSKYQQICLFKTFKNNFLGQ